jgi:putative membrane protein
MLAENDPRVFFAAERTLLAWIRTALGSIGLGFVVERFGLFVERAGTEVAHRLSPWIGVALVTMGGLAAAVAALQHRRFRRSLGESDRPVGHRADFALMLGFGVALAGLALAGLLVL